MEEIRFKILIFMILVSSTLYSQDIHFTQFFSSPATVNPALAGFSNSRFRFFLNHRNQWAAVSVPFQTFAASVDAQIIKRKEKGDMIGIGLSAFSDKAGDSKFGTQQASLSLSYVSVLGNSNRNLLGFGIQASFVQRSLDYNALYFDNQYNGSIFDPSRPTGETFAVSNYSYPDLSAGINWFTNISYDFSLQTGFSLWHLNRPVQSLKDDKSVRLSTKGVFYSEAEITLSKPYRLMPAIFFQRQGTFSELMIGSRFKYIIEKNRYAYSAFITGLFYRNRDAIALLTGFEYKNMKLGLSYDFNISSLHPASNYRGGLEIYFTWKLSEKHYKKPKDLPCPIF